jgi:hypothetical protein
MEPPICFGKNCRSWCGLWGLEEETMSAPTDSGNRACQSLQGNLQFRFNLFASIPPEVPKLVAWAWMNYGARL